MRFTYVLLALSCSLSVLGQAAHAQTEQFNSCAAPLAYKAFDTNNKQQMAKVAWSTKESVCNTNYTSEAAAHSAATSAGANVNATGFGSARAAKATMVSNNSWSLRSSDFCKATEADFASEMFTSESSQVATAAVAAWERCVTSEVSQGAFYVRYQPYPSGGGVSGWVYRRTGTGADTTGKIRGMTSSDDSVLTCRVDAAQRGFGTWPENDHIAMSSTRTAFECSKSAPNKTVHLTIITNLGPFENVVIPSATLPQTTELNQLQAQVNELRQQLSQAQTALSTRMDQTTSSITALSNDFTSYRAGISNQMAGKLNKNEWPDGRYVIFRGKNTTCPPTFAAYTAHLRNIQQANLSNSVSAGDFGDSSISAGALTLSWCEK